MAQTTTYAKRKLNPRASTKRQSEYEFPFAGEYVAGEEFNTGSNQNDPKWKKFVREGKN